MICNEFWNRLKIMFLCCWFAHIILQLKTKLKKNLKPSCQLLDPVDEMVEWVQQIWPSKQDSVETVFMSTGSPEQLELFRYNSKKVFDVYISQVYPVVQDEMDFTF